MLVPCKLSSLILCLRVRQESYHIGVYFRYSTLRSAPFWLYPHIRLGFTGLTRTNTLAYNENSKITGVKVYNICIQIEGGWNEDGKGLSIWDVFAKPGSGHIDDNLDGQV